MRYPLHTYPCYPQSRYPKSGCSIPCSMLRDATLCTHPHPLMDAVSYVPSYVTSPVPCYVLLLAPLGIQHSVRVYAQDVGVGIPSVPTLRTTLRNHAQIMLRWTTQGPRGPSLHRYVYNTLYK
jgi:hypothetical protein